MRRVLLLLPVLLLAGPALGEPLKVAKGMWSVTSDIYMSAVIDGAPVDIPSEHSTIEECWSTDQDVTIDEGIATYLGECTTGQSWAQGHSFDIDLYCDFDGIPMNGTAEFAVSKGGGSFSGRIFLSGGTDGADMTAEALMIGHTTGACAAPN
jgi:hypothetical protein